jgi:hypothetical protein
MRALIGESRTYISSSEDIEATRALCGNGAPLWQYFHRQSRSSTSFLRQEMWRRIVDYLRGIGPPSKSPSSEWLVQVSGMMIYCVPRLMIMCIVTCCRSLRECHLAQRAVYQWLSPRPSQCHPESTTRYMCYPTRNRSCCLNRPEGQQSFLP